MWYVVTQSTSGFWLKLEFNTKEAAEVAYGELEKELSGRHPKLFYKGGGGEQEKRFTPPSLPRVDGQFRRIGWKGFG